MSDNFLGVSSALRDERGTTCKSLIQQEVEKILNRSAQKM